MPAPVRSLFDDDFGPLHEPHFLDKHGTCAGKCFCPGESATLVEADVRLGPGPAPR